VIATGKWFMFGSSYTMSCASVVQQELVESVAPVDLVQRSIDGIVKHRESLGRVQVPLKGKYRLFRTKKAGLTAVFTEFSAVMNMFGYSSSTTYSND